MLTQARAAIVSTLFFTLLLGVGYPLVVTGIGKLAFSAQAGGSLIRDSKGQVIGSSLIAQNFTKPEYLHPRPSAAGADGYDASGSSGSNLGPLNEDLAKRVAESTKAIQGEGSGPVPADAVTTSGSGLDPDISPANAARQASRVAAARGVDVSVVKKAIAANTTAPWLGVFGQPRVNVLQTNLALDAAAPVPAPASAPPAAPAPAASPVG
ncbi:potassium-transporting ATPase subunit KdpC (plasmid) [Phenylobacterium sp. LH3H17]|uniref:potassium-transporting ATPase subunit KdpC n=1 Tax=Phenylobacterium sp. LH3H17 TaxID=2903901 RepID=UPI0020C959EE|nr:potassium-transporting ATPase subunit KdpC [Phenylobacterium sp. LH3H17]UTP41709.1 potassium-transporting ATPase subunit KdpC [Phenylobacterium sp. LH3H17]